MTLDLNAYIYTQIHIVFWIGIIDSKGICLKGREINPKIFMDTNPVCSLPFTWAG